MKIAYHALQKGLTVHEMFLKAILEAFDARNKQKSSDFNRESLIEKENFYQSQVQHSVI
jgi:hypothetical protein